MRRALNDDRRWTTCPDRHKPVSTNLYRPVQCQAAATSSSAADSTRRDISASRTASSSRVKRRLTTATGLQRPVATNVTRKCAVSHRHAAPAHVSHPNHHNPNSNSSLDLVSCDFRVNTCPVGRDIQQSIYSRPYTAYSLPIDCMLFISTISSFLLLPQFLLFQKASSKTAWEALLALMNPGISAACRQIGNESVPIQLAQCWFPFAGHFQC